MSARVLKPALLWFAGTFVLVGISTFLNMAPGDHLYLYVNRGRNPVERAERTRELALRLGVTPAGLRRIILSREHHALQSRLIGTRETADFIRGAQRAGADVGSDAFKKGPLSRFLAESGDRELLRQLEVLEARMAAAEKK